MDCPRSITFTLVGTGGAPGVVVTAVQVDGRIEFSLSLTDGAAITADLRGLFFDLADDSKMAGLGYTGGGMVTEFDTVNVVDLGQGANMYGTGLSYDVGMEIGTVGTGTDTVQALTFTLFNAANNLTLDDIAHMDFGAVVNGQRLTAVAPAAPDAKDDTIAMFEDGQGGLDAPSATAQGVKLQVLKNDTDADGQKLTITHVDGAMHGTVQIVDGDDADDLAGDAILYTPSADFAGTETIGYCISDGNGGTDSAHVNLTIAAVADVPALDVKMMAGDKVNEMRIVVTANAMDKDGSEFIDRIEASGLPAGATLTPVSVNPGDQPGTLQHEFVLTLPTDADSRFDLTFSAYAKEKSNGDEEVATHTVKVEMQHEGHDYQQAFAAQDQSIWSSGDAFQFDQQAFIGVDESAHVQSDPGDFVWYDVQAGFKTGFTQEIHLQGGEIDAEVAYDVSIDTLHNKMTDQLQISGSAIASAANFFAQGPEGSYELDFDFDFDFSFGAGLDFGVEKWDIFGGLIDFGAQHHWDIVDIDSQTTTLDLDDLVDGMTGEVAWPHLSYGGGFAGSASSTDMLWAQLDADEFLAGDGPNVFDIPFDLGFVWGNAEMLDVDLWASLGLTQGLELLTQGMEGLLHFEDGSSQKIVFGKDLVIDNASLIDAAGDHDGTVEFGVELFPSVMLHNETNLAGQVGYNVDLFKISGGYGIDGTFSKGPIANFSDTTGGTIANLVDETFDLAFESETVQFGAWA